MRDIILKNINSYTNQPIEFKIFLIFNYFQQTQVSAFLWS